MGAPKKADWREERRKQAWNLKEQGWQQNKIAKALGVSKGAVSQWMKRGREGGFEALKASSPKGVKPKLSNEQKAHISSLLAQGAEAYGFRGDVWTGKRIAEVVYRHFGVRYHPDYAGRLLREAGLEPATTDRTSHESVTKKPSNGGMKNGGQPLKKSRKGAIQHSLGRRSWFLSGFRWLFAP